MRLFVLFFLCNYLAQIFLIPPTTAGAATIEANSRDESNNIDFPPEIVEESPVLQKWLEEIPNVLEDIKHDPAFRSRVRLGFTIFPSSKDSSGLNLGIEDIFIKRSGFTLSVDYQTAFNGDRNAAGADLHYFLLPLGSYFNFAPLVGYRYIQSNDFFTDGVRLGLRLMLALSRTGGGDISVSQSFVSVGGDREVGITSFSVGYAVAPSLRLSGDIERQNSIEDEDNRFSLGLEWLF
ncbi:hypothetical protein I4641_07010 [Waterburya agarophytonicola K14]|uniref:Outer membrane protein beta-barrel domain-containing protein n=1 Tax=Waterburya agarophytonicola KI4 TaxID=2874699 RepID=A0A964FEJ2_9CYAN|nr:hypothetical protein [Waterburya agarophytonicola]MCC0176725.1 hypothetical protein [Waterburya agarophytonicola KI4]